MHYSHLILLMVTVLFTTQAQAQFIREDFPFNYGTLVITDNSSVHTMRIRPNGNINPIDPELIQIGSVNAGRFDFRNFPPNTTLNPTVTPTTVTGPGGNFFTITNFQFPSNMTTNNSGHRNNRRIGSRLRTSGNGLPYTDGLYTGTILLEVTY